MSSYEVIWTFSSVSGTLGLQRWLFEIRIRGHEENVRSCAVAPVIGVTLDVLRKGFELSGKLS